MNNTINPASGDRDRLHSHDGPDSTWMVLPGSGHGFVRRSWITPLAAAHLTCTDDFFAVRGEALTKPGLGRRYRARLTLGTDADMVVLFLKRYGGESLREWIRRWVEDGMISSVAEREVRVAAMLTQANVPAVQPVAWGRQGTWGPRQKSFVVMTTVPGISLENWLHARAGRSSAEDWRLKCAVTDELAFLVRRLHQAGWRHRDLYLCHVFVDERAPMFTLTLLDLARVFRPRLRSERWLVKDLAQLLYSAQPYSSRSLRMRFLHQYLNCRKLNGTQRTLARRIVAKCDQIAQRDRRKTP